MIRRAAHRLVRAAAAVTAYLRWRPQRDAVRAAYRVWTATSAFGEALAIEAYQSALDGEERRRRHGRQADEHARHPAEIGPAHQMALTQALPGTWERR